MNKKQLINKSIEQFYNNSSEETRLNQGMGVFEFERIKTLIEKYIPNQCSTIIDVGGGTGKYAEWLAKKGHVVHLVDPIKKHIKLAQNRAHKLKNKFTVNYGEARKLEFPNNFADLIILHGPLYHLQKREDRALCIKEAKRILKNNGIILGFAINYTASTLIGLLNGYIHKKPFLNMCKEELTTGLHHQPDVFPWVLAEAYYHRPEQLKEEFINQQLHHINIHAVEGIAWLDKDFFLSMVNNSRKETLLQLLNITETDDALLAFSPHIMIATKKLPYEL